MRKSVLITLAMAVVLFLYGFFMSNPGHDHAGHDSHPHEHTH